MARLILLGLFIAAILIAVTSVVALFETRDGAADSAVASRKKEDAMPAIMRKTAYVLLVVLMIGVTTGWLVAAS